MNIKIIEATEVTDFLNSEGAVAFIDAPIGYGICTSIVRQTENNGMECVDVRFSQLEKSDILPTGEPTFADIDEDAVVMIDESASGVADLWSFVGWLTARGNKVIIPVRP